MKKKIKCGRHKIIITKEKIQKVYEKVGSKTVTACLLNVSLPTMQKLFKKYSL